MYSLPHHSFCLSAPLTSSTYTLTHPCIYSNIYVTPPPAPQKLSKGSDVSSAAELRFIPDPYGGGLPYTQFSYAAVDKYGILSATVVTVTVNVACGSGRCSAGRGARLWRERERACFFSICVCGLFLYTQSTARQQLHVAFAATPSPLEHACIAAPRQRSCAGQDNEPR